MKNKEIWHKVRKIGELMGERSIFRIGVDVKNNRIDLLSVDACIPERQKESKSVIELPEEMEYIG